MPHTVIQFSQALLETGEIQLALLAQIEGRPELLHPRVGDARGLCVVHGGPAIFGLSWLWRATHEGRLSIGSEGNG